MTNNHTLLNEKLITTLLLMKNRGKLLAKGEKKKITAHWLLYLYITLSTKLLAIRRKMQTWRATAFGNKSNREKNSQYKAGGR